MSRSLCFLLVLQVRGWMRNLGRGLRTVKGALVALFGVGFLVLWLLSAVLAPSSGAIPSDELRRYGPAFFLLYCLLTVILSRGERALYFSPGEVNFLFAGPFSRRELLLYKLATTALLGLPATLILALLTRVHAHWFLAAFLALFLVFLFQQLFTMAINLVGISLGAQAYTRARKLLLTVVGLVLALAAYQGWQAAGGGGPRDVLDRLDDSAVWRTVTMPLVWFVDLFLTQPDAWLDLARNLGLAGLVVLVLAMVVFLLDAHYLEAAATASERIYTQIQRMRRGEAVGMGWRRGPGKARFSLPSLPWWGGIGPNLWRQLTTAFRSLGRLLLFLMVFAPILAGPLFAGGEERQPGEALPWIIFGTVFWLTVFMTTLVPFDFRGDLDRIEVLKTLPLPAWRLTLGQLLAPALLLGTTQSLVLVATQLATGRFEPLLLGALAAVWPFNLLVFGLDNLLFLCFPSRLIVTHPGDFQTLGRNVLLLLTKTVVLVLVVGVAGGVGWLVGSLTGGGLLAAAAAGWLVLTAFAAAVVPLVAWAFTSFDVARDMPA